MLEIKKHIFDFAENIDINDKKVKRKALAKMDEYYLDEENELKSWIDKGDTCIFAFEGLGEGFGSVTDSDNVAPRCYHKPPYNYLNAMMVVTKGKNIVYVTRRASTLPDGRPGNIAGSGTTTLHAGIYDYMQYWHKGYAALIPIYPRYEESSTEEYTLPGWYKTPNHEFYSGKCSATDIHACDDTPKIEKYANSMGCQIIYSEDYFDFGLAVGFLSDKPTEDASKKPVGTNMKGIIGEDSDCVNNGARVKVKYILDRTYDEKNKVYSEGIFYPTSHEVCSEKCKYCNLTVIKS